MAVIEGDIELIVDDVTDVLARRDAAAAPHTSRGFVGQLETDIELIVDDVEDVVARRDAPVV